MTDRDPCGRCGQTHTRCTAHTRAGNPCKLHPRPGQTVCRKHGGSSPQALSAAERRIQEAEARVAARTFGLPLDIDHTEALLEELHRTAGEVAWLGHQVSLLTPEDAVWGITEQVDKNSGEFPGTDTTRAAKPNAYVLLWHQQRRHLLDVAKACHAAGIEERRVRIAEQQGLLLAGVVRAILARLDLTDEQQQLVPVVVPEEFRRAATLDLMEGPTS